MEKSKYFDLFIDKNQRKNTFYSFDAKK